MIKYIVSWTYRDLDHDLQQVSKEFDNLKEAIIFKNHITEMTQELLKQYGVFGIYNPYRNIKLIVKEEKYDIREKDQNQRLYH